MQMRCLRLTCTGNLLPCCTLSFSGHFVWRGKRLLIDPKVLQQHRFIRTQIPPRPVAVVICHMDQYGNVCRNGEESDVALVRTRSNEFYLQRVFDDESVVRFPVPGLACIKNQANMEYFNLSDIDNYGGVHIPRTLALNDVLRGVCPDSTHRFLEAVVCIRNCEPGEKYTRKKRRLQWHRIFTHPSENRAKELDGYAHYLLIFPVVTFTLMVYSLFSSDVSAKKKRFDSDHPEISRAAVLSTEFHGMDGFGEEHVVSDLSPGLVEFSVTRRSLDPVESDEVTGYEMANTYSSFSWRFQHFMSYGHWPSALTDGALVAKLPPVDPSRSK